jgi:3-oxoacyl-(acyl-carrier-protein) synthase
VDPRGFRVTPVADVVELALGVTARVVAAARVRVPAEEMSGLRDRLAVAFPTTLGAGTLKQCDELTLVAIEAVRRAQAALTGPTPDWGVLAGVRTPGRRRMTDALARFRDKGAWGVTPHFIPHSLLHSAAGLVGQAFGLHGPGAGVGGTPGSEADVLRAAAAWLAGGDLPGAWVVWAGWSAESLAVAGPAGEAMAAALVPAAGGGHANPLQVIAELASGGAS